jgi:hypothetical protein
MPRTAPCARPQCAMTAPAYRDLVAALNQLDMEPLRQTVGAVNEEQDADGALANPGQLLPR